MPHSFNRQLLTRFVAILLLIASALLIHGLGLRYLVVDKVQGARLANARAHYAVILADLDQRWGREAFNLKARIEAQDILAASNQRHEKVQTYLISQGSSIEFPSLRIDRVNGEAIAAYDYSTHVNPKVKFAPSQVSAWAFNPADHVLHYANRQFIWLGRENGYLTLFKPLDHATLTKMTYPGTRLSLWWKDRFVASSDGDDGLQRTSATFAKPENGPTTAVLSWSGPESENTPKLLIEILPDGQIGSDIFALPGAVLFAVLLTGIFAVGYSFHNRISAQFDALKMGFLRAATLHRFDSQASAQLAAAEAGPHESGRELAAAMAQHLPGLAENGTRATNLPLFPAEEEH